ncbi:hypothetical protein TNCV_232121 [Trichonephila clavipes]|nr:hypothetical protein TNCV_232121 [Trichonephila clavipes]
MWRLLLAENDEESVAAFAEKLNMKDAFYILAEAWDSLERQSLKNAWNKLRPDLEEESDPVDDEMDEDEDNNNNESSKGPSNADALSASRNATPTEITTDDEDMITYDVEEEDFEQDPFILPEGYLRALTPSRYRNYRE